MASAYFTINSSSTEFVFARAVVALDLNKDGINDTVFGGYNILSNKGRVSVLYGDAGGFEPSLDLSTLDARAGFSIDGRAAGDEFGASLGAANDLKGKGDDALLIGATGAGEVSVLFSGDTAPTFKITGLSKFDRAYGLTGIGDFNGDGIGDFAIGDAAADSGAGAVYVIYGASTLSGALDISALDGKNGIKLQAGNAASNDAFGYHISATGPNASGLGGILIGAPGDDEDGTSAGTAYIVHGASNLTFARENLKDPKRISVTDFKDADAGDETGKHLSAGMDVNGDGKSDALIAARLADGNGASSGAVYVIFDVNNAPSAISFENLDGTNGYVIEGRASGDQLGTSAEILGDVSGDGIADIAVATKTGEVYLIYGSASNNAGRFDLSTLDGSNGLKLSNLFSSPPDEVILAGLGDINADASGAIADFSISGISSNGKSARTITLLGGADNLDALDAADGTKDGEIDFSLLPASAMVDFVETDPTVMRSGDKTGEITEDSASTSGAIGISDTSKPDDQQPSFSGATATGALGLFVVNTAGNLWSYTVNDNSKLQYLDADDEIYDHATFTADNGVKQKITIKIVGLDDPSELIGDIKLSVHEDTARSLGKIRLSDPDEDDNPSLSGAKAAGAYGEIAVADDGTFTYLITSNAPQDLDKGETLEDRVTLTADDGSKHTIVITLLGEDEDATIELDGAKNKYSGSFGDDVIKAYDGDDEIDGGAGDDEIDAGPGNDIVTDALGDSKVLGGSGQDKITLLTGNNSVSGGDDSDFIVTGYRDDIIDGGAGNDVIAADEGSRFIFGNNLITGGADDDIMMGGQGIDAFIFRPNDGKDEIGQFDVAQVAQSASGFSAQTTGAGFTIGIDKVRLEGFSTVTSENVLSFLTSTSEGAVFSAEGTTILFKSVLEANFTIDEFVIV